MHRYFCVIFLAKNMPVGCGIIHLKGAIHSSVWSTTSPPSFCSGSCDEIDATTKLQNKTSLKDSGNTHETFYKIFSTHT